MAPSATAVVPDCAYSPAVSYHAASNQPHIQHLTGGKFNEPPPAYDAGTEFGIDGVKDPVVKSVAPSTSCYASVLHGKRDLHLKVKAIPSPEQGELQIAVKATGICGSDVSYYQKLQNGDICCGDISEGTEGLCLGHESSGIVVAIGPGTEVKGFRIGDRVALEVGIPCGSCGICRKGRYNLCRSMRFRSSAKSYPPFQGTLQEIINHPAMWCHKIPDRVSFEAAALLEPLSVAIHATNRAALGTGSTALVIGAGAVGLLTAAMALQAGCTSVTIMDVDSGRVDFALKNKFATHGYKVKPYLCQPAPNHIHTACSSYASSSGSSTPTDGSVTPPSSFADMDIGISGQLSSARELAADVLSVTQLGDAEDDEDLGVDCTFECTGKEACMQTALYATRPGGRVIMVGMGTPIQTLPMSASHLREVDILGIFRYCNTYPAGLKILESGRLPKLDDMVTHRFDGLGRAKEAFELAGRTKDDNGELVLKVVIKY